MSTPLWFSILLTTVTVVLILSYCLIGSPVAATAAGKGVGVAGKKRKRPGKGSLDLLTNLVAQREPKRGPAQGPQPEVPHQGEVGTQDSLARLP